MNLHGIVSGIIGAVNPHQKATIRVSTGYVTQPGGKRIPSYADPFEVMAQLQDLSGKDLHQLSGLNVQGSQRVMYVNGTVEAVVRVTQKGGDLITLADNSVWLTTQVLEQWPDWCKISVTLQNGS